MTQKQRVLTVGIQGPGTSTVKDLGVISDLLREDMGITIEQVLETDVFLGMELLKQGKIDFFYEHDWSAAWIEGNIPDMVARTRGPFQMRMVASAHSGATGFMVRGDSPIQTIYDIGPSTRLAVTNKIGDLAAALLAWLGLHQGPLPANPVPADWRVKIVPFPTMEAALRSIGEGTADVTVAAPENPVVKESAVKPPGIRFLELPAGSDHDGVARFRRVLPFGRIKVVPNRGVKEIWNLTSYVGCACLWCCDTFDEELAYLLTKWFDQNFESFKDKGNKLDTYTREAFRQSLDFAIAPVHAGTVRYFKEIGIWHPADENRLEYNRKLMDWYCAAWAEALKRADTKGIKVVSSNGEWLRLWNDYKKLIGIPVYRVLTDEEISEVTRNTNWPRSEYAAN